MSEADLEKRDDKIAKEFEKWAGMVGISSIEFDALMVLVTKGLKYVARDIAEATMSWDVKEFIKQQVELQKDKDESKGVFKD